MEHRRRTLSSALDDEMTVDVEKQTYRRRGTSASLDESINQYSEYVYNGSFNVKRFLCCGILNLIRDSICCCCCRQKPSSSNTRISVV